MLKFSGTTLVGMLIGGIVAGGSALMYGVGKLIIDARVRCLKDAAEIRDSSNSGYGYIEGPLHTDNPIMHNGCGYVRLDESVFHITTTKVVGYDLHTHEKRSDFENKAEFVHRTAKQAKPIFVNNIDIGAFIQCISLKKIDTMFSPISDYVANNNGQVMNVNIHAPSNNANHLLGEHEKQVIGVEQRRSGIKVGKVHTIFGLFDTTKQKMKKSHKFYNIVTKQSRDQLIESEESFSRSWKLVWGTGIILGCAVGGIGFVLGKQ